MHKKLKKINAWTIRTQKIRAIRVGSRKRPVKPTTLLPGGQRNRETDVRFLFVLNQKSWGRLCLRCLLLFLTEAGSLDAGNSPISRLPVHFNRNSRSVFVEADIPCQCPFEPFCTTKGPATVISFSLPGGHFKSHTAIYLWNNTPIFFFTRPHLQIGGGSIFLF